MAVLWSMHACRVQRNSLAAEQVSDAVAQRLHSSGNAAGLMVVGRCCNAPASCYRLSGGVCALQSKFQQCKSGHCGPGCIEKSMQMLVAWLASLFALQEDQIFLFTFFVCGDWQLPNSAHARLHSLQSEPVHPMALLGPGTMLPSAGNLDSRHGCMAALDHDRLCCC